MSDALKPDSGPNLACLFGLEHPSAQSWTQAELGAILRHQLRAPLQAELTTVLTSDAGADATEAAMTVAELGVCAGAQTFADLLSQPRPPLELVRLMKDYAKAARRDGSLPSEVATLLYYLTLAIARLRCGTRIGEMDDAAIRAGLEWCVRQAWVRDNALRSLLEEQLAGFNS